MKDVAQISKPAGRSTVPRVRDLQAPADLEVGDTTGLETRATWARGLFEVPARRSPILSRLSPRHAFTLLELILVMAMLVVVLGVALPSLSGFFRGRNLDAEARRFVSLARYGQSRAVSEGIPTVLWVDARRRAYGLELQPGYTVDDPKAVEFVVDDDLELEVQTSLAASRLPAAQQTLAGIGRVPMIRFLPTGFVADTSPDYIVFRQGAEDVIWIAQSPNRLSYEIQTDNRRM